MVAALIFLAAGACTFDLGGNLLPDTGHPDSPPDETEPDAPSEDMLPAEEILHDPFVDGEIVRPEEPEEEDASDIEVADEEEPEPSCGGKTWGGYCWYPSEVDGSCTDACAGHGGCNIAGTRDYAGSGGTDEGCRAVLEVLDFEEWQHFDESNNDLGCQYAWNIYTYWSTFYETTCEAVPFIGENDPHVIRMCACER